jgi:O-antigen/teichoic acid export membrane protein
LFGKLAELRLSVALKTTVAVCNVMFYTTIVIFLVALVSIPLIYPLVFTAESVGAIYPTYVLLLGLIFSGLTTPVASFFTSKNFQSMVSFYTMLSAIALTIFAVVLTVFYNILGMTIAIGCARIVSFILLYRTFSRLLSVSDMIKIISIKQLMNNIQLNKQEN